MGFSTRLVAGGAIVGAVLAYYVHGRRQRTGEGYLEILRLLPSEAQSWLTETRERATLAIEDGVAAARRRDEELARDLTAAGPPAGL